LWCSGRKVTKHNEPCKKCRGTGQMPASLQQSILETIQREVARLVPVELQRQSQILSESRRVENFVHSMAMSAVSVAERISCSQCHLEIPFKSPVYVCMQCPECGLCEKCRALDNHTHPLLHPLLSFRCGEPRTTSTWVDLKAACETSKQRTVEVAAGTSAPFYLRMRNNGTKVWPLNTKLEKYGDPSVFASSTPVGNIPPHSYCDIVVEVKAPKIPGTYSLRFALQAGGKPFGDESTVTLVVVAPKLSEPLQRKEEDCKKIADALIAKGELPFHLEQRFIEIMGVGNWAPQHIIPLLKQYPDNNALIAVLLPEHP
jgi:hypothetical protein